MVTQTRAISIPMEDSSNWDVSIILDDKGEGAISLHWCAKTIPTHQARLDIETVKQLKEFFNGN